MATESISTYLNEAPTPEKEFESVSALFNDAFSLASETVAKPLVNSAVLEPAGIVTHAVDGVAHQFGADPQLSKLIKPMDVATAPAFSTQWYLQGISSGLGAIVPYTIAGKTSGAVFRKAGSTLAIDGVAAALLKNEHAAFVVGAMAYDGIRPTRPGETHMGNAFGGASGFLVFGVGNSLAGKMKTSGERVLTRAVTGLVGADVQNVVSTGISQNRLPTMEEITAAGAGGAAMNMFLPPLQNAITKSLVARNSTRGGAWLDHYLSVEGHDSAVAQSPEMQGLVAKSPWTKVKVGTEYSDFNTRTDRVELSPNRNDVATIGRELSHLRMGAAEEPGFVLSAQLLAQGKSEAAWEAFRQQRTNQETNAQTSQNTINRDLSGSEILNPNNLKQEIGAWPAVGGVSYEQRWRQEFHQFQQSGGQWRPGMGVPTDAPAYLPESAKEAPSKPLSELSPEQRKAIADREIATQLVRDLQKDGYIAVFAGGAVRDKAMGLLPNDYDIATSAPPDRVQRLFAEKGYKVDEVGKQFGIINLVVDKDTQFEIASLRNDGNYTDGRRPDYVKFVASLYEDAARRDLTINAMFVDPTTGVTYDFFGGRADIANKQIRTVGDPSQRFAEDKLRMMRVPRFAARFGFSVEPGTKSALTEHAPEISTVAPERVAAELYSLFGTKRPIIGLDLMKETGLMKATMPEIDALDGPKAMQDPVWHPEGVVWNHTRKVVDILSDIPGPKATRFERILGGLSHDTGKLDTQKVWPDGGISNHGHDAVGAKIAKAMAKRLKLSNDETTHVVSLVELHMKMHQIDRMPNSELIPLLESPYIEDLKALQHADATGTGRADGMDRSKLQWITDKQRELTSEVPPAQRLFAKPIIDGDVLVGLGLKPSKRLGEIKNAAQTAQRNGLFQDSPQAMEWLFQNYPDLRPPSAG